MTIPWQELDPGIVDAAKHIFACGFMLIDFGDGSKYSAVDGALPFPHVFCIVEPPGAMINEANRAHMMPWPDRPIGRPRVEAIYSPSDGKAILAFMWPSGPP